MLALLIQTPSFLSQPHKSYAAVFRKKTLLAARPGSPRLKRKKETSKRSTLNTLGRSKSDDKAEKKSPSLFSYRKEIRDLQKQVFSSYGNSTKNHHVSYRENRHRRLSEQASDRHVAEVSKHSQTNGIYFAISDLHWGLGLSNEGRWHPEERFRYDDEFVKFIDHISRDTSRKTTLNIGGDWLGLTELLPTNSSVEDVKKTISKVLEGHRRSVHALVLAVSRRGLRVLFEEGNHDPYFANPTIRKHLVHEMGRIAGLNKNEQTSFRERIAYAGHTPYLGETLIFHGHAHDPVNNFRSSMNPYSYVKEKNGVVRRSFDTNAGWEIVQNLDVVEHLGDVMVKHVGGGQTRAMIKELLKMPDELFKIFGLAWKTSKSKHSSEAIELANRLDDRMVMRAWAKRNKIGSSNTKDNIDPVKAFEHIYSKMPAPIYNVRENSNWTITSFVKMSRKLMSANARQQEAASTFLGLVTELFPMTRVIMFGHDHSENFSQGRIGDRPVAFFQTGTWTPVADAKRLNVSIVETDNEGTATVKGLFRVDPETGFPSLKAEVFNFPAEVPGWSQTVVSKDQTIGK